jgi:hypothetical protein
MANPHSPLDLSGAFVRNPWNLSLLAILVASPALVAQRPQVQPAAPSPVLAYQG